MTTDNFLFLFAKQTNPNQSNREVNGTMILTPLVFPGLGLVLKLSRVYTGIMWFPNGPIKLENLLMSALSRLVAHNTITYCSN